MCINFSFVHAQLHMIQMAVLGNGYLHLSKVETNPIVWSRNPTGYNLKLFFQLTVIVLVYRRKVSSCYTISGPFEKVLVRHDNKINEQRVQDQTVFTFPRICICITFLNAGLLLSDYSVLQHFHSITRLHLWLLFCYVSGHVEIIWHRSIA